MVDRSKNKDEIVVGQRPFRIHIDPAQDGSEVVSVVADHIRAEYLRRIKLGDLLLPHRCGTHHKLVRSVAKNIRVRPA